MRVDKQNPRGKHEYEGATCYFCSSGCERSFEKGPERFLDPDYTPGMGSM